MSPDCPPDERLARMLDSLLEAPEARAVEAHVASCADCQRRLEAMTAPESGGGEPTAWSEMTAPPPAGETVDSPSAEVRARAEAGAKARARGDEGWPDPEGYRIERVLGRGGMGVVYLATQLRANRLVALKMVIAGRGRPEDLIRFRFEAESLARLHHPNIVQVFDVGECEGQPFFTMEYVPGGTLAAALAEHPRPPREAAALAEALARAVHAAHQAGVVHRDLKPANILLSGDPAATPGASPPRPGTGSGAGTGQPALKITDFGLAKATGGDSDLTGTGQILGTPSYMAPEQATGQGSVGVPADVYALGAILYEALAGRPPFRGASPWETMMQAVHEAAPPPSRWQPGIPRDLEVICLKCLAKDPAARYPSADALAEDLRRYLAGESILARPAGLPRLAWLWCRRHPGYAALLGLLLASVAAGAAGVAVQWRRAEAHLADSRRRLDLAMRAVERYYTGVSRDVLLKQAELASLRSTLLTTPLEFYRSLREELKAGSDPESLAQLGDVLSNLGKLNADVGREEDALAAYREAVDVARDRLRRDPGSAAAAKALVKARIGVAEIDARASRLREARDGFEEALALAGRLAARDPGDLVSVDDQATCLHFLGDVAADEKQLDRAEEDYLRSLDIRERLVRDRPDEVEYLDHLGGLEANLAILYADYGRLDDARKWFVKSLDDRRRLSAKQPDDPEALRKLSSCLNNLGSFSQNTDRLADAPPYYEEAREIQGRLVRDYPTTALYQEDLAITHQNLSTLEASLGHGDVALREDAEGVRILRRLAADHPDSITYATRLIRGQADLGRDYLGRKDYARAEAELIDAVAYAGRVVAAHPESSEARSRLAYARAALASVYHVTGRTRAAEGAYREAVAGFRQLAEGADATSDEANQAATCGLDLATLLVALGRFEEAEAVAGRIVPASDRPETPDAPSLPGDAVLASSGHRTLGDAALGRSAAEPDPARARTLASRALDEYTRASSRADAAHLAEPSDDGARHALADARAGTARALEALGRFPEAIAAWDLALKDAPDDSTRALVVGRAATLCLAGRSPEALDSVKSLSIPESDSEDLVRLARVYCLASPPDAPSALASLLRAATSTTRGDGLILSRLLRDRAFDPLRASPEFRAIALDLGFPADPFGP
ncbi:Serine/threonine-protein kinase PrkC [Aquisphaera giovannonii]|uniref:non-specific serine/threonine protein kinase n=1 Tax=Aquisphaera giovannonii TaxID=406548 RepID=A0A5B9WEJ6_9BACT|nr:protein kinase [Aquisphaera giovannonii]QEH39078.1 Serine/threonine-protein kinase PrkC [Aquisphaera giovannonii]